MDQLAKFCIWHKDQLEKFQQIAINAKLSYKKEQDMLERRQKNIDYVNVAKIKYFLRLQ